MIERKITTFWMLFALLFAQVSIAHHSVSHFDHSLPSAHQSHDAHDHGHHSHDADEDRDHDQDRDVSDLCSECLVVKSMQQAYLQSGQYFSDVARLHESFRFYNFHTAAIAFTRVHHARAPPQTFLI